MRKERKPRQSPLSAIKDSVDPTQDGSPSELLALCSGQFAQDEDAQMGGASTSANKGQFFDRSLSDGGDTQGVRELLGLTGASKNDANKATDSIARLFSSFEGGTQPRASDSSTFGGQLSSQNRTQEMNEVIGLCSGVFPTTQTQLPARDSEKSKFKFSSRTSNAGTSDGMSDRSSDEEGEEKEKGETRERKMAMGDEALLRWAKRQRHLQSGESRSQQHQGESDSEDEDMPRIKRRRIRLKKKPSKQ